MKVYWTADAWDDYTYWQRVDRTKAEKIKALIKDITENDLFKGLGKPEPLKHDLSGFWSRRITGDHRLIYRVTGAPGMQQLEIVQCRFHY
jgi:toxin YoeB